MMGVQWSEGRLQSAFRGASIGVGGAGERLEHGWGAGDWAVLLDRQILRLGKFVWSGLSSLDWLA